MTRVSALNISTYLVVLEIRNAFVLEIEVYNDIVKELSLL